MKTSLCLLSLLPLLQAAAADFTVLPDANKQTIKGIGFEIQSDSIGSGNHGLPEEPIAVPHDLVPAERERLAKEMLAGFRYCRLAGGLYWRGLDPEKKFLKPRWPEQLAELKTMLDTAKVEGICFEYWSPAPFWKGNGSYFALPGPDSREKNRLRCFSPGFDKDPVYNGDTKRFLTDFANAVVADIKTLEAAGMKVPMWGLQNEPNVNHSIYSSCEYPNSQQYVQAYTAVASAIRKHDPSIYLFADTEHGYPKKIGPAMKDPAVAALVDAYCVHTVGAPSENVRSVHDNIRKKLPHRPWFQNEYEYLTGGATPDRCLNTVQHIMNSFQIGENPTWFWIHALKPLKNAEASGYSLGFWRPANDTNPQDHPKFPGLKPGQWTWNKYNWHAVGSFVRRMPWDCRGVVVKETKQDPDLRVLAFRKPDGKLTVVLANRSFSSHTFKVATGLENATFKGYRFTPDDAGEDFSGVPIGTLNGGVIAPQVADMTWEFWEQQ